MVIKKIKSREDTSSNDVFWYAMVLIIGVVIGAGIQHFTENNYLTIDGAKIKICNDNNMVYRSPVGCIMYFNNTMQKICTFYSEDGDLLLSKTCIT